MKLFFILVCLSTICASQSLYTLRISHHSNTFTQRAVFKDIVVLPEDYARDNYIIDAEFKKSPNIEITNVHITKRAIAFNFVVKKQYLLAAGGEAEVVLKLKPGNSAAEQSYVTERQGTKIGFVADPYDLPPEFKENPFDKAIEAVLGDKVDRVVLSVQLNQQGEPVAYLDITSFPPMYMSQAASEKYSETVERTAKYIREMKMLNAMKPVEKGLPDVSKISVTYDDVFSFPSVSIQAMTPANSYMDLEELMYRLKEKQLLGTVIFDVKIRDQAERSRLSEWFRKLHLMYNLYSNVIVCSFDRQFLKNLKSLCPNVSTGLCTTVLSDKPEEYFEYSYVFFSTHRDITGEFQINRDISMKMKQMGISMGFWNVVRQDDDIGYFLFYMDYVLSTNPAMVGSDSSGYDDDDDFDDDF